MFDLDTIKALNRPRAVASSRRRAVAMNRPNGHAKDAEKGRFLAHLEDCSRVVKTWPIWKQNILG